jgi:hypothetical protein
MKRNIILCLLGAASLLGAADIHYEKGDKAVQFAAKDLARCLTKVSGRTFQTKESPAAPQAGDIILVNDPKLEKQQWQFAFRDGKLYISGRGAPGLVYGVYTFLEKYADCAWPAPDVEVIPEKPGWKLPEINEKGKPAIMRREFYVAIPSPDYTWRMRNKENFPAAFGLHMRIGSPNDCHTFDHYVKAVRAAKNPKLFGPSIRGGECRTLCMTNPEVRRIVLEELLKYIEKDREKAKGKPAYAIPKIYDLSQSDGPSGGECWCQGCRELAEREGSYSAPNLDFVNYMARGIREKYPDVILQTFAYSFTQKPPKTIKAEKNVMIRYCDASLYRPLIPGTPNGRELETWSRFVHWKSIWSYWRIFTGYLYPFVKTRKDIAAEFRFCVKNGVYSYFGENEAMLSRSFSVQQHYLGLKMMDDPMQDIEKLNARFMREYYGAAAPFMQQYLEYLEKRQKEDRSFLDKEFFEKVNGWLDAAENATRSDARSNLHVRCERVIVDRTMFLRLDELMKQGCKADLKAVAERFLKNGLDQVKLWTVHDRKLRAQMEEKHRGEADLYSHYPVPIPEQFKGCEIIDMHWNQLQRTNDNAVKDPDAVCGMAIRNPKLPQTLPFKLGFYSTALRTGSGLEFLKQDIPQDEKFHLYKLGRIRILAQLYVYYDKLWEFRTYLPTIGILGEERDIWVSMKFQGKPWVEGSQKPGMVLIDRLLLVKDDNPLRKYKPVDASKNLLKNGGFENYSDTWINQWGKPGPKCRIDTEVRHSGKASLRLGNVEKHWAIADANLGKIKDLKNDLLIRGWYKYENIKPVPNSLTFIGLQPFDAKGYDITSYRLRAAEFFTGSYDWRYFERVVEIDELKKKTARLKPLPGERLSFRIFLYHQPGTVWVDDLEVIPLEKK